MRALPTYEALHLRFPSLRDARRSEELRSRLLGPDASVLLLSVGRLSVEKRIDVLATA